MIITVSMLAGSIICMFLLWTQTTTLKNKIKNEITKEKKEKYLNLTDGQYMKILQGMKNEESFSIEFKKQLDK